jgi:hypothetical protein
MTKNKKQVLEALAFIGWDGSIPPYNATHVQDILRDDLGHGDFDLPNLTRTLKALVEQGLAKQAIAELFVSGSTGCVESAVNITQDRPVYWPTDLDLSALKLERYGPPEDFEWSRYNFISKLCGQPAITKEQYLITVG